MAALMWALGIAAILAGGTPAPVDAELIDLDGRTSRVWTAEQRPEVVMVVRAQRLRTLKSWETRLRERFEDLSTVRIADFPEDPRVTYDDVASKLRDRVPEGVRVFLDRDHRWARDLKLDTAKPNLLLLDDDGNLAASFRGRYDAELFERVCAAIDASREAPR